MSVSADDNVVLFANFDLPTAVSHFPGLAFSIAPMGRQQLKCRNSSTACCKNNVNRTQL